MALLVTSSAIHMRGGQSALSLEFPEGRLYLDPTFYQMTVRQTVDGNTAQDYCRSFDRVAGKRELHCSSQREPAGNLVPIREEVINGHGKVGEHRAISIDVDANALGAIVIAVRQVANIVCRYLVWQPSHHSLSKPFFPQTPHNDHIHLLQPTGVGHGFHFSS